MKLENPLIALVITVTLYSFIVFAKYILLEEDARALIAGFFMLIQISCLISILDKRSK